MAVLEEKSEQSRCPNTEKVIREQRRRAQQQRRTRGENTASGRETQSRERSQLNQNRRTIREEGGEN